jgi:hypothetical protein
MIDFRSTPVAQAASQGNLRSVVEYLAKSLPKLRRLHFELNPRPLSRNVILDALFRASIPAQKIMFNSSFPAPSSGTIMSALNCAILLCEREQLYRLIHYPGFSLHTFFVDEKHHCIDVAQKAPFASDIINILYSRYLAMLQLLPSFVNTPETASMVLRALSKCPLAVVKFIELGFNVETTLPNGVPLLFQAVKEAPMEIIRAFSDAPLSTHSTSRSLNSDFLQNSEWLIEDRGANPHRLHKDIPLAAYAMMHPQALEYVCALTGVDLAADPTTGSLLMLHAVESWTDAFTPIPRCVLDYAKMYSLNPNVANKDGTRLLSFVLQRWVDIPFAHALLASLDADPFHIDADGSTALHAICQLEVFSEEGVPTEYQDMLIDMIRMCARRGVSWLSADVYGRTPLDIALSCQEGSENFLLELIKSELLAKRDEVLFLIYRMCQMTQMQWDPAVFREILKQGLVTTEDSLQGLGKVGEVLEDALGIDCMRWVASVSASDDDETGSVTSDNAEEYTLTEIGAMTAMDLEITY